METEKIILNTFYLFIFVSLVGLAVFISANFMNENKINMSEQEKQKIKITVPEVAPAALSGKWKLIK